MALNLEKKESLSSSSYSDHVVQNTAIGRGLVKMADKDKDILKVCFNTAYYITKYEKPFSDYVNLIHLQQKNGVQKFSSYVNDRSAANFADVIAKLQKEELIKQIQNCKYYSILIDGSTDSAVIEEELVYILLITDEGRPEVKFLSIEAPKHTTAEGLKDIIKIAFSRIDIEDYSKRLCGLNIDGASVNTGIYKGLGTLLKESAPWLSVVHCFNHRFELAIKDAFKGTFFDDIDIANKIFYLYQKSPKRLRELKEFAEIYEKSVPKPAKAGGTRWIDHKFCAMSVILQNYGIYITHLESLAQTDSQSLKRAEIEGFVKKWEYAKYPLYLALYIDILTPIKVLSQHMQQEVHDPITFLRRVQEFTWTMAKLKILVDNSLEGATTRVTNYTKFLKEVSDNDEGKKIYQQIILKEFTTSKTALEKSYGGVIEKLCHAVEYRFNNLYSNPIYDNMIIILNVNNWPTDDTELMSYGDESIGALTKHFDNLLKQNGCQTVNIISQWDILKNSVKPLLKKEKGNKYLDVWSHIFKSEIKSDCQDVLHIIELLLLTPFSNAKLERMFSRMNRVKTDYRNRLSRERLESCLRISEEGPNVVDFNPDKAVNEWFNLKIRRMSGAKKCNYPKKRKSMDPMSSGVINIAKYTLSDFEESESDESSAE